MKRVLTAAASLSKNDIVKIVDAHNKVIGSAPRHEMRKNNLYHRCTYIFLYNSLKQYYVQKRTTIKDYCPGWYDLATGGVVAHGEIEDISAIRELKEEMGVTVNSLKEHAILPFDTNYEGNISRGFGYIYSTQYDGPITMQPEEVEDIVMWDGNTIERMISSSMRITPDSVIAYKLLKSMKCIIN